MPFDGCLEPAHVAAGDRLQEGIEHGGGEPLVFAELGLHLAGERDVDAGQRRPQRLTHAPLVLRIEEREKKAHGHALGSARLHVGDGAGHVGIVERPDHLARRSDALGDLEAVLARHQRLGMVGLQIVDLGSRLAADLQQVLEAGRSDERNLASAPLDQRVGCNRGAVGEEGQATLGGERTQALQNCARGIVGRGGDLVRARLAGRLVHQKEVGESAADVDPERRAHRRPREARPRVRPTA